MEPPQGGGGGGGGGGGAGRGRREFRPLFGGEELSTRGESRVRARGGAGGAAGGGPPPRGERGGLGSRQVQPLRRGGTLRGGALQAEPAGGGRGAQAWASIGRGAPGVRICQPSQRRRRELSRGVPAGGSTHPRLRARRCSGTRRRSSVCDEGGCRACAWGPVPQSVGIGAARGWLRGRSAPAARALARECGLCHGEGGLRTPSAKSVPGYRRKGWAGPAS